MPAPFSRRAAVAIVLLALAVRLAAGVWWQSRLPEGTRFFFGDSESYWALGQRLARGESYQFQSSDQQVFRARLSADPVGPVSPAGHRRTGLLGPSVQRRARRRRCGAGDRLGRLAVRRPDGTRGRIDCRPVSGTDWFGALVLSEAAVCPLIIAQLWLWGAASRSDGRRERWLWSAAAGIAAGLATLVRPSWLLFTPFAALMAIAFSRHKREQFTGALVMLALLAAVLAPWWIRNARIIGHFVPTTLQVGASLYDGLNPTATGASDMRFAPEFKARLLAADQAEVRPSEDPLEYRLDRLLAAEAVGWAQAHPLRVLELAGIKLVRLWNVWPNENEFRGWPLRLAVLVTYVPVLLAGLYGVWRFTSTGWPYALAWLPAVYLTLLHTIFVSSLRYREPAMLGLIVLAAAAITGAAISGPAAALKPDSELQRTSHPGPAAA